MLDTVPEVSPKTPRLFTRAFVLLSVFYFTVFLAGYQLFPIVPLHLRSLGANLAESGRFMGAFTLGSAVGSLFTGPLGDRLGQRRVLRVASLLMVAFFAAYAFIDRPEHRWIFYVLAPIHGLVWSGLRTASVAKAGSMLAPENRAEGMSFFGMSSPAGIAVGPLVGLLLWPILGFRWMLLFLGALYVALHLLIKSLPKEPSEHRRRDALFQLPERVALWPSLLLFLIGVSFGPVPPYSAQEAKFLHLGMPSAFLTSLALGIVGLRLVLGLVGLGKHPIRRLSPMLAVTLAGMALLALLPGGTVRHILAGVVYGAGYGMVHTLMFMHIIDTSRANRRGAAVGVLYFSYDLGQAAGALALGWVMERVGAHWGLVIGYRGGWAVGCLALAGCLLIAPRILRPRLRDEAPTGVPSPS
jgi:MFS family permease